MEIVKLPEGERAPPESDCISIQEEQGGGFTLNTSALVLCDSEADEESEGDSASVIGGDPYGSYDEAEAAGLAWADAQCVEQLYVARSKGTAPLPD